MLNSVRDIVDLGKLLGMLLIARSSISSLEVFQCLRLIFYKINMAVVTIITILLSSSHKIAKSIYVYPAKFNGTKF